MEASDRDCSQGTAACQCFFSVWTNCTEMFHSLYCHKMATCGCSMCYSNFNVYTQYAPNVKYYHMYVCMYVCTLMLSFQLFINCSSTLQFDYNWWQRMMYSNSLLWPLMSSHGRCVVMLGSSHLQQECSVHANTSIELPSINSHDSHLDHCPTFGRKWNLWWLNLIQ